MLNVHYLISLDGAVWTAPGLAEYGTSDSWKVPWKGEPKLSKI